MDPSGIGTAIFSWQFPEAKGSASGSARATAALVKDYSFSLDTYRVRQERVINELGNPELANPQAPISVDAVAKERLDVLGDGLREFGEDLYRVYDGAGLSSSLKQKLSCLLTLVLAQ